MRLQQVLWSVLLLLGLSIPPASFAQLPPIANTTSTPIPGAGHDYLGGISETVNPANGSANIRIPAIIPPGRGFTLPFSFAYGSGGVNYIGFDALGYGNAEWLTPSENKFTNPWTQGGWSESIPTASKTMISWISDPNNPKPNCFALINFLFQDAHGNRHNLGLTNYNDPNGTGQCTLNSQQWPLGFGGDVVTQGGEGPLFSSIPSAWNASAAPTVIDGGGLTYGFPGLYNSGSWLANSVSDRNGNFLTINSSFPTFSYLDTVGRTVLQDSGFARSPETLTVSGLGAPYTLTWITLAQPTFTTPITTIDGTCTSPPHTWGTSVVAVASITLPNEQSFSFTYDPVYALVNKMTYPSGGYVRYVWGTTYQEYTYSSGVAGNHTCDMYYGVPSITDRYVSFDGTHEVLHQHYSYSVTWSSFTWSTRQTTVTTYDLVRNTNSQIIYSYSPVFDNYQPNAGVGPRPEIPVESSIAYYDTNGTLLKTVTKGWKNERMLASLQTTFPTSQGGQSSLTVYCYNTSEVETEHDDYDFGNSSPTLPSCANGVPSGTVSGSILRKTVTNYATSTAMSNAHVIDKPASVILYSDVAGNNKVAETDFTYDNPTGTVTSGIVQHSTGCNCGNVTKESRWVNGGGTMLSTTLTNDNTGQRLSMTDPRGNITDYSYADNYSSGTPPGPTNAYLTQITYPNTGVAHIEKFAYAYATGEVTSSTDQNNQVTSYKYNDNLARPTETDFPDGGVTTLAYNDSAYNPSTPSPSVTSTKKINSSTNLVTVSAIDGVGHPVTSLITSDPQGTIHTDTAYDGLGRVYTVSNPYRSGSDPTTSSGTTTYAFDALGRKITETEPDASVVTTAYCGPNTLVTDPTGKWRRSRVDGLGRLVEVDEPNSVGATVNPNGCPGTGEPVWVTSYTLDTLGNLKQVVQNGSHQRNFTYDFLSRLLTAANPETGTITYNFDSDTNCASPNSYPSLLVSKVDARGIRTCAQYDALNRPTQKTYSDGTLTVYFAYEQTSAWGATLTNTVGRLTEQWTGTSCCASGGAEIFSYDKMGRPVLNEQYTPGMGYRPVNYVFDLGGNVTSITYPSGRAVNYTFDAANRPKTATDGSNGITYATDFQTAPTGCLSGAVCYTPQGTFYTLSIGQSSSFTGLNLTHTYNNRLQPNEFKASSSAGNAIDITYNFVDPSTNKNAGHVYGITNNLNGTRSQTFGYDQLNRITSALTTSTYSTSPAHCWGETYGLDAWANLQSISATTNPAYTGCSQESGFSRSADGNNHLNGFVYDNSGNTQNDGSIGYTWDAESQLTSAASVTYTYDAQGRRVTKSSGKNYVYDLGGDILAETDGSGNTTAEYIFFGGKRVAMLPAGGNPTYYVEDLLGTSRVITQNNGGVCYDADFYPYGGERPYTNTCPQNYKFEGKERDTETGNDDFGARYYSNRFGRWLSADWSAVPAPVPYANLTNPQTLNLYAMVADDPESFADLDGHDPQTIQSGEKPTIDSTHDCGASSLQAAQAAVGTPGCGSQGDNSDAIRDAMDLSDTSRFYTDPGSGITLDMSHPERNLQTAEGMLALTSLAMPVTAPAVAPAIAAISVAEGKPGDAGLSLAAAAPLGAMARVAQLGKAGEEAAQIVKNTERIASETGAAYRVPDMLNHASKTIGEVKNTAKVYLTNQMKDIISYASKKGYSMELVTRAGARLSKSLDSALQAIKATVSPRL